MTHPDDPQSGRETVSFGPSKGDAESVTQIDADDASGPSGEIDAWYSDDGSGEQAPRQPSWFASRWRSWQSVDRDRRIIIVLAAVTVLALLATAIGLTDRDDSAAIELPAVESHGLNPDEAACFAFGLIQNRFEARLESTEGIDEGDSSELSGPVSQEIDEIDDLAAEHPEADYRLITAFAAVADAGTVLTETDGFADLRSAADERVDAVAAAGDECDEVAGFDVDDLEPN